MNPASPEFWSFVASIVSVVLGFGAVALSVYFFVSGKATEKAVSNSLIKIETQTDTLQRITGRQLDRLTKFVVDAKGRGAEAQVDQLLTFLVQIVPKLEANVAQQGAHSSNEVLVRELLSCYIGLYYYCALTNYWAQFYLPKAEDFDAANGFHALVQRVTDQSAADFIAMAQILERVDRTKLSESALAHLLNEAVTFWRDRVRSSAQVFAQQGTEQQ